jgi:hypothetical protein
VRIGVGIGKCAVLEWSHHQTWPRCRRHWNCRESKVSNALVPPNETLVTCIECTDLGSQELGMFTYAYVCVYLVHDYNMIEGRDYLDVQPFFGGWIIVASRAKIGPQSHATIITKNNVVKPMFWTTSLTNHLTLDFTWYQHVWGIPSSKRIVNLHWGWCMYNWVKGALLEVPISDGVVHPCSPHQEMMKP